MSSLDFLDPADVPALAGILKTDPENVRQQWSKTNPAGRQYLLDQLEAARRASRAAAAASLATVPKPAAAPQSAAAATAPRRGRLPRPASTSRSPRDSPERSLLRSAAGSRTGGPAGSRT